MTELRERPLRYWRYTPGDRYEQIVMADFSPPLTVRPFRTRTWDHKERRYLPEHRDYNNERGGRR